MKQTFIFVILGILLVPSFILSYTAIYPPNKWVEPDFFLGIDVAYDDMEKIKDLIDEVDSYTNLFVIGCTGITYNTTKLDDLCQYLKEKGLYFIIYTDIAPRAQWLIDAKERWGNYLLGFYAFDEAGGYQLDLHRLRPVQEADNITDAANKFVTSITRSLEYITTGYTKSANYPLFSSDYALYWFDYKGGYDVMLAQLGWNYSRELNIALVRGAATVQNKEWGAIFAWTYNNPPYIESGPELYEDLVLAYENGAKYLVIFDSNKEYTQGILKDEHLEAIKQFWEYTKSNPRQVIPISERVAFVLPKDYAYGFRGPIDKVWGLWEASSVREFSDQLCTEVYRAITLYQERLDIIYDDDLELNKGYSRYIFWNGTIIEAQP